MPSERDRARYAAACARVASVAGVAPVEPHITLIGAASADFEPDEVPEPFAASLVAIADSETPTRCITLTAERRGPLAVVAAPHLSLLYGSFTAERRDALRAGIDIALPTTVEIVALALYDTSDDDHTRWSEIRRWVGVKRG